MGSRLIVYEYSTDSEVRYSYIPRCMRNFRSPCPTVIIFNENVNNSRGYTHRISRRADDIAV